VGSEDSILLTSIDVRSPRLHVSATLRLMTCNGDLTYALSGSASKRAADTREGSALEAVFGALPITSPCGRCCRRRPPCCSPWDAMWDKATALPRHARIPWAQQPQFGARHRQRTGSKRQCAAFYRRKTRVLFSSTPHRRQRLARPRDGRLAQETTDARY